MKRVYITSTYFTFYLDEICRVVVSRRGVEIFVLHSERELIYSFREFLDIFMPLVMQSRFLNSIVFFVILRDFCIDQKINICCKGFYLIFQIKAYAIKLK